MRADRDAAGADEHVRLETALERAPVLRLVVRDGSDPLHLRAGRLERRREHRCVRLVDLAGAERLPRRPQLGAGAEDDDARPPGDRHLRCPGCRERADLSRADQGPGREHDIAGADVSTGGPDVCAGIDRRRHVQLVVCFDNNLDRDDRVRAVRHGATGRDRHRLARSQRTLCRYTGSDSEDNREADRACRRLGARSRPSPSSQTAAGRPARSRPRRENDRPRRRRAPAPDRAGSRGRARAGAPPRSTASRSSGTYANGRDLGGRPGARRRAQRRAPPRRALVRARSARAPVGGRLRRRRLDGRDVRGADPPARAARRRARRPPAAELRQGGGTRRPASRRRRATSSSRSTATCRTTRPRSHVCSRSSTRASTSSPAGRRSAATRSRAGSRPGSSTASPAGSRDCACTTSTAG